MVQLMFLTAEGLPSERGWRGDDASICGDCKFRLVRGERRRTCYVDLRFVDPVWKAWREGRCAPLDWNIIASHPVRLGSYGDPASMPTALLVDIVSRCKRGFTGYTHMWRDRPELRSVLMASVDTPAEAMEARMLGWRTFRTKYRTEGLAGGEIICPATTAKGPRDPAPKTTCADCLLCDGSNGDDDKRRSIVVGVLGMGAGNYTRAREGNRQLRIVF